MKRLQLWSCGGGRQSAGIGALIKLGRLPKPDWACMVALEWEMKSTYRYVNSYIRPAMRDLGIPFTYISRKKYATVGFWSGEDGRLPVLPAYSNLSGKPSKLSEYCSGEWKREVSKRWAAEQPGWKERGVDNWIGISWTNAIDGGTPERNGFKWRIRCSICYRVECTSAVVPRRLNKSAGQKHRVPDAITARTSQTRSGRNYRRLNSPASVTGRTSCVKPIRICSFTRN